MKPKSTVTHEHFFPYDPSDPANDERDDASGRYDAYETDDGKFGVWSVESDLHWETKNFAEARRLARALAAEYAALYEVA
jgi:hypothetical protein